MIVVATADFEINHEVVDALRDRRVALTTGDPDYVSVVVVCVLDEVLPSAEFGRETCPVHAAAREAEEHGPSILRMPKTKWSTAMS